MPDAEDARERVINDALELRWLTREQLGALFDAGKAEAKAHEVEYDRLRAAVREAIVFLEHQPITRENWSTLLAGLRALEDTLDA